LSPSAAREPSPQHFFFDGTEGVVVVSLPINSDNMAIAATGVDLKNSLCITGHGFAEASEVIGDINDPAVYEKVATILNQTTGLNAVACDLHPDLHSTRLAAQLSERLGLPLIQVQHHHAHIAAVMAEFEIESPVVGLAMDGYGFGTDGSAWGGECLYVDGGEFQRAGHLKQVAMPGGDAASREPWRMAVAWLNSPEVSSRLFHASPVTLIQRLCDSENTPLTSSAGRLFDAVSAIVLGRRDVTFEGEAAIALEQVAAGGRGDNLFYYQLKQREGSLELDFSEMMHQLVEALLEGKSRAALSAGFHTTLAAALADMAIRSAAAKGVEHVVLAGGCFLNRLLKEQVIEQLETAGLRVLCSQQLPEGDGAIALGQAWVAIQQLKRGDA